MLQFGLLANSEFIGENQLVVILVNKLIGWMDSSLSYPAGFHSSDGSSHAGNLQHTLGSDRASNLPALVFPPPQGFRYAEIKEDPPVSITVYVARRGRAKSYQKQLSRTEKGVNGNRSHFDTVIRAAASFGRRHVGR